MKIFYFTSTGNSLYVAKRIGGELVSIPQMLKEDKLDFKDDAIGFVFPCYALGVPKIVKEFVSKAKFNSKYFFAVVTAGGTFGSTLLQFQTLLNKKLDAGFEIKMVDNFLPMFEIEKQLKREPKLNIERNIEEISKSINELKQVDFKTGIGKRCLSVITKPFMNFQGGNFDNKFSVDEKCNSCGICKQVCPKNNIEIDIKPVFKNNCAACLACIHLCSKNALDVKGQKSKERFINPNVTLNELIKSNKQ